MHGNGSMIRENGGSTLVWQLRKREPIKIAKCVWHRDIQQKFCHSYSTTNVSTKPGSSVPYFRCVYATITGSLTSLGQPFKPRLNSSLAVISSFIFSSSSTSQCAHRYLPAVHAAAGL